MAEVVVYHNPNCSSSRSALEVAEATGAEVEVVRYLTRPPDAATLRSLLAILEDPATDLVRRDQTFAGLGLSDEDVATEDQVVAVLVEHPKLFQRPVVVAGGRAVIGRPKDRVAPFLAEALGTA